jgi:hypothetical protein
MNYKAALVSLATSVPPHLMHQNHVLAAARDILGHRYPEFETLSSVFANTGVSSTATGSNRSSGILIGAAGRSAPKLFWKAQKRCSSVSRARRLKALG